MHLIARIKFSGEPHQVSDIVSAGQGYTCSNLPQSVPYAVKYDAWGNVTSRSYNNQTATLSYNKLDEMVEWQVPSANQAWYAYDASGNRTLERSTVGSTTTETVYAFGLEEYSYDSSGNLTSSTHYYSLAGHLIGEAQTSGSSTTTNFFLTDDLGSVLAVISNTESSASLLSNQVFSPYGTQLSHNGNEISQYTEKGFTGQYNDPTSGLDYYVSRYYDPVAGIFLSPDVKEGNAAGLNPYAYVGGNPETDTDPTGQYYSNGTQLGEHGGEIAYVSGNVITTVTNDGAGTYWSLDGTETWNSYGGLSINTFTRKEETLYGGYNSDTDASNSPLAKFEAVTGWTQLQQSWNAPGANTQSRLEALGKFAGTNINNVLQLAAIMGGPEDDGVAAAADEVGSSVAQETGSVLYRVLRSDEDPALGLFAKDPGADKSVIEHILQGSKPWFKSQFISTTNDLSVATSWATQDGLRIAEIDASKVIGNVIDVSTREGLAQNGITYPSMAYSFARSSSEVLIKGRVPPEAIIRVFLP